jgi:hypothetical protein
VRALSCCARPPTSNRSVPKSMRDIETIDSDLRSVAAVRRTARERGGPLPSIDVADALLDERHGGAVRPRRYK